MKKWEVFKDERSVRHLHDMINFFDNNKDRLNEKKNKAIKKRAITLIDNYLKHFNISRSEVNPNIFD